MIKSVTSKLSTNIVSQRTTRPKPKGKALKAVEKKVLRGSQSFCFCRVSFAFARLAASILSRSLRTFSWEIMKRISSIILWKKDNVNICKVYFASLLSFLKKQERLPAKATRKILRTRATNCKSSTWIKKKTTKTTTGPSVNLDSVPPYEQNSVECNLVSRVCDLFGHRQIPNGQVLHVPWSLYIRVRDLGLVFPFVYHRTGQSHVFYATLFTNIFCFLICS